MEISTITGPIATGYFHLAVIAASLVWTSAGVYRTRHNKTLDSNLKASRISKRYEFPSQIARTAALAFAVAAALGGEFDQWYTVALTGCAFLLGLTRLANNLEWRHIALHQVNLLVTASLLLLVADEVFPVLKLGSTYRPTSMVVGAIVCLLAATLAALVTPREWTPPAISFEILHRPADAGPSPEETCSWWTKFLSYGFLNALIWKGELSPPAC